MNEDRCLTGASTLFGHPVLTDDGGFGPLWLYRTAGGERCLVRAQTFEDALEAVYDLLPTVEIDRIPEAYGLYITPDITYQYWRLVDETTTDHVTLGVYQSERAAIQAAFQVLAEQPELDLVEGYQFQPNASGSGIIETDLNGEDLREVPPGGLSCFGVIPIWETED